jgi:transcriptional enhancer factor
MSTPTSSASSPGSSASSSSSGSPTSSTFSISSPSHPTPLDTSIRRTFVCIELLPTDPTSACTTYDGEQSFESSSPAGGVFSSNGVTNVFRPSSHPRPICSIDPTITFVSQSVISAQSSCLVLLDGTTVHKEVTPLSLAGSCPEGSHHADRPLLYGVKLVPSYWKSLCQSSGELFLVGKTRYHLTSCLDLTRYTIIQQVTRSTNSGIKDDILMFSAVYHFSYPQMTDSLTPSLPSTPTVSDNEAESFMASPLDDHLSSSWYSDLFPLTDTRSPSKLADNEECGRGAFSALHHDIGASRGPFPEDVPVMSPMSSCFPTDLSNYII